VPGLGPKRALQLSRDLGVRSVDDLAAAIKAGRLDGLAGFGARSEERIAAGIEVYRQGRERERVRALAAQFTGGLELLHGTELNIGPDGSVDWDARFLAGFDICVASVHSHFEQSRAEMTRRFVTACENPYVNVIGHPTARRMGKRPPVEVDFGELFRACARTGTALEINASPQRLDLPSDHIRAARDAGVKFAVDSDAHSVSDLGNMPYGTGTAQRGWLTPDDVINTWPLDRLRTFLRKGR
jgi:DNA polymerase (family X)